MERQVQNIRMAHPSTDGAGVAIQRVAGFDDTAMDPVLMLDELRSEHRADFEAGFPPHPHRGMQTLTYMINGGIIHEDSAGNRGEIRSGGAQYMSAGRGIIHSEMPTQDSLGLHGFQLWFNLPAAEKMSEPRYRDLPVGELANVETAGVSLTAIAGSWQLASGETLNGPLEELAPQAAMADLRLKASEEISLSTEQDESVMVYIYDGSLLTDNGEQRERHLVVFGQGGSLRLQAGTEGVGALVLRGKPIGEPVVHYGPFVMNTAEEIEQTLRDYQSGRFAA